MATKWRNLATSIYTKITLFILFLGFVFAALWGSIAVYRTVVQRYLPFASVRTMEYIDSDDFLFGKQDIEAALYWKYDIDKLYNIKNLPTFTYRVEFEDGTVTGKGPADLSFYQSHKVYGVYKTRPDGEWEIVASSYETRLFPPSVAYGQTQIFSDHTHSVVMDTDQVADYSRYNPPMAQFSQVIPPGYNLPNWDEPQYTAIAAEGYASSGEEGEPTQAPLLSPQERDVAEAEFQQWLMAHPVPQATIYYAFDDASLATYQAYWQQCRSYYLYLLAALLGLGLGAALCALWLLIVCGRRPGDRELHLLFLDKLWAEVTLGISILGGILIPMLAISLAMELRNSKLYHDTTAVLLYCAITTAGAGLLLLVVLSPVRLLKAHCLLRSSLTYRICYWCWRPFAGLWDRLRACFDERAFRDFALTKALQRRQMVFFGALGGVMLLMLLVALASGAGAVLVCGVFLTLALGAVSYWQMSGNKATYEEINKGFNESFEEQMKSERTKTALITNVSHDLKTPLTSIITYLDLLEKEELPDTARDYVTILTQKSQRLKTMVADLFDLSKSASGNLALELETLDLRRLIDQTLADMRDHIDSSGLTVKPKLPEGEVNIYSDGKKLYRVFQNLIDNALKYSLTGSRVYVTLEVQGNMAIATVKNTAGYEMEFTAEEILQRFTRGDQSRTGEGSGLGLSIAESFTQACGGDFKVELDGDLFKVTLTFPTTALPRTE